MESWIWLIRLWREQWNRALDGHGYGRWVLPVGYRPSGRGLAGKAFDQATPLYSTGISCFSMTWNSSTINVANSPLYLSRWSITSDTACCIASNVGCHLLNAFCFMNFHSRSIRFTLGLYGGTGSSRNSG